VTEIPVACLGLGIFYHTGCCYVTAAEPTVFYVRTAGRMQRESVRLADEMIDLAVNRSAEID